MAQARSKTSLTSQVMEEEKHKSAGSNAVKRLLQKYLKKLIEALPKLEQFEKSSQKDIGSLANLVEQRSSVLSIRSRQVQQCLEKFPDLQQQLMVKLSVDIREKVEALEEYCSFLEELHLFLQKGREEAVLLCCQYQHDLDIKTLLTGEAVTPPIYMMLSWLVTIEKQLREQCFSRRQYLKSLCADQSLVGDELQRVWESNFDLLLCNLQDCQEQCKYLWK